MDQALQGIAAISCGGCIARYGTAPEREPEAELPSVDGFNGQWYTTINNDNWRSVCAAVGIYVGMGGAMRDLATISRRHAGSDHHITLCSGLWRFPWWRHPLRLADAATRETATNRQRAAAGAPRLLADRGDGGNSLSIGRTSSRVLQNTAGFTLTPRSP